MSELRSVGSRHARHDGASEGVDAGAPKLVGSNEGTIYKTFKQLLENEDEYNKMSRACIRDLAAEGYELPLMRTYPLTLFGGDRAAPGSRYSARVKSSLLLVACQTQTRNVHCWNFEKGKPTNGRRPGSSIKEVVRDGGF